MKEPKVVQKEAVVLTTFAVDGPVISAFGKAAL
jgi:hypothetical protein